MKPSHAKIVAADVASITMVVAGQKLAGNI
jgi:hypothetical protein